MSKATEHPRCPFYPAFCKVEAHRMPEHVWVSDPESAAARAHTNHETAALEHVAATSRLTGTLHLPKRKGGDSHSADLARPHNGADAVTGDAHPTPRDQVTHAGTQPGCMPTSVTKPCHETPVV